jgi:hypothetical protein
MKKFFAVISILGLVMGAKVFADNSATSTANGSVSPTPSASTGAGGKHQKKKKTTAQATPQVTLSPTVVPSPTVAAKPTLTPAPSVTPQEKTVTRANPAPTPSEFSTNIRLYDRVGAPGDLRQAVALASMTLGSSTLKHDRSVFLWLGKITNGQNRQAAYIRLSINGVELGGPRKPWVVLTGTVYDQSGSDAKAGDPIEVGVDFRDVKVDYEGTKLGEVQKGNDISDQLYELLETHPAYQWVLLAQDRLRDPMNMHEIPAYVVNAREGYTFLETLNSSRDRNNSNTAER